MAKVEIVEKCKSWLGLNSLFQSTLASRTSISNRISSIFKAKPSYTEYSNKFTGLLDFEELKEPKGFDLLLKDSVRKAENIMRQIKKKDHNLNPAVVCDEILDLYRIKRLAQFVMLTHPEKKFVDAAQQVYFKANQCINKLYTNDRLCDFFVKVVKDKHPALKKAPINTYFINMLLYSFRSGELILDEERTSSFARPASQPLEIGSGRRKWWQLFSHIPPNEWYIMLIRRLRLAKRYRYDTYADFALAETIAGRPYFVLMFLENLKKQLKPMVNEDLGKIVTKNYFEYKKSHDIALFITRSKENIFGIDSCVEDYFSFDTCMDGLELILRSLYDVILEVVDDKDIINGDLWHDDVKKYCVREGNKVLGYIYFDLFARPNKSARNTFLIQSGKMCENGTDQTPIVIISLSFPNPGISQPPLLKPNHFSDLFYEMGHAIHCIFAKTKYQLIHGTRCDYDLSRISSCLMLYFAADPRVLQKFAKHYQTREAIPDDLIEKLLQYRKKYIAYDMQLLVFNAAFDQASHSHLFPYFSFSEIFGQVWKMHFGSSRTLTTDQKDTFCRLIFRGRALHCCYLLSNAIAALIWSKYFRDDPLSQLAGKRYRNTFLAQSGLKPALALVEKYLKIDLTPECLSTALLKTVKAQYKK